MGAQLFGLGGGACEQGLPDLESFKHALDVECDQEFFLDDEGRPAIEHVGFRLPWALSVAADVDSVI